MAYVWLTNMVVLDNPVAFTNPFRFGVTFECTRPLDGDLEWEIVYVVGGASEDMVLEQVLVGPVWVGTNYFVLQSPAPNPKDIPEVDKVGVAVVLVTCAYKARRFLSVGYFISNEYTDPILLENPPEVVDIQKVQRNILAEKPYYTGTEIVWAPVATDGSRTTQQPLATEPEVDDEDGVDDDSNDDDIDMDLKAGFDEEEGEDTSFEVEEDS